MGQGCPNILGQGCSNKLGQCCPNKLGQGFPNKLGHGCPNTLGQDWENNVTNSAWDNLGYNIVPIPGPKKVPNLYSILNTQPQLAISTTLMQWITLLFQSDNTFKSKL